jgi:hypothetical protein
MGVLVEQRVEGLEPLDAPDITKLEEELGMLGTFVPFRAVFRQPLTFAISLLGSGLSLTMTMNFCQRHWPADGGLMLVALGLLWELAKLHLAARGLAAVVRGSSLCERLGGAGLIVLALILAAGSVGASVGCLAQTEQREQRRTLASSRAYTSAVRDLDAIDSQIALLTNTAADDLARGFRKRALDTSHAVEDLRRQRDAASRVMRALEQHGESADTVAPPHLPGRLDPARLRLAVHVVVAALLEVVSMVGMFLLERDLAPDNALPGGAQRSQSRARRTSLRSQTPSPARVRHGSQAADGRPYTQRLTYRFGRAEGALNLLGDSRRYQACRELMRRIGDYCLKVAWTDGLITEAQLRTLSTGTSWRATQGHLNLLLDAGALLRTVDGRYEVAYFFDENPSVVARETYAQEQRDQARARKQRERSRGHAHSASNPHVTSQENANKSVGCAPRHAEPTITHLEDANAATHAAASHGQASDGQAVDRDGVGLASHHSRGPAAAIRRPAARGEVIAACEEFEDRLPWEKYLTAPSDEGDEPAECRNANPPMPPAPTVISRVPRLGVHRSHVCVPARLRDDGKPINLGDVLTALRQEMQNDHPEVADTIFRQLSQSGITQTQLRYATYCLKVRRQKVDIENPLAYWLSIAKGQCAAARRAAGGQQEAA